MEKFLEQNLRIICIVLLIILLIVIFIFSSQNSRESLNTSSKVTNIILKIQDKIYGNRNNPSLVRINDLQVLIRKLAHYILYIFVGVLLIIIFTTLSFDDKYRLILSMLISGNLASIDEIHQMFIYGRTPKLTDGCRYIYVRCFNRNMYRICGKKYVFE
ncbi:MAG: VanZ family protein [Clostridia bacterium]|nr:VanZ family protein [Clostridia bacterium]